MTDDDIMPLICIRCRKDIPLTLRTMKEISYTHYSYCEDCLREGLRLLKDKEHKEVQMVVKRTSEEIQAYVDGYNDCNKQFRECLKNRKTLVDAIRKMDVFVSAVNNVAEKTDRKGDE